MQYLRDLLIHNIRIKAHLGRKFADDARVRPHQCNHAIDRCEKLRQHKLKYHKQDQRHNQNGQHQRERRPRPLLHASLPIQPRKKPLEASHGHVQDQCEAPAQQDGRQKAEEALNPLP